MLEYTQVLDVKNQQIMETEEKIIGFFFSEISIF